MRLIEKLCGVGEEVSDQQVATLLLCCLPDEYETLITALEARDEDELTLEYVKTSLLMLTSVRRTVSLIQQNQELNQQCTLAILDLIRGHP